MLLGSHNSFTYSTPALWYLRPFNFVALCQSKNIRQQYSAGARVFDLRLRKYKDKWYAAHGPMLYLLNWSDLEYLNRHLAYIRIGLEYNKDPLNKELIEDFKTEVITLLTRFPDLKVYNIFTKWDGRVLLPEYIKYSIVLDDKYSSTTKPYLWDDWFPRLYAIFNNKKNLRAGTDKDCLFIDFI